MHSPVRLAPHGVFDVPVKLFVPLAGDVDITAAGWPVALIGVMVVVPVIHRQD
jgi:hypothetical protein